MKKKLLFLTVLFTILFTCKNVYAFDVNNYKYKGLCGTYEVAGFHTDGVIDPVACYSDLGQAQTFMRNNGADDLAIMTKVNGETKIIDANMALLDLSVNPTQLTYFYENSELTSRQYTYMDTGSLYGGVDGGFLGMAWSSAKGKWVAKVRTGNFTGWIPSEAYEIVPITWIKSYSFYTVTNDNIRHNYVTKIQNEYRSSGGNTIGPKPTMLNAGTYYSYDGHYFYDSINKLMKDYKNNTYANSVNVNNPYYNYYMYLSNHSKTAYSSINIDEYIRNNMGYTKDVYGHVASDKTSRLYGSGTFFYYAQQKYGVNAILSLSLSRNETANGRSFLAVNKNNGFGLNAVDSNPINGANWYATFGSSILGYASKWVTYGYAHPRDWRYFGPQFGDKWIGMNVKYASDTYWSEKMASNYYSLDKALGLQDYNYYQLGVLKQKAQAYSGPSTSSKWLYEYPEAEDAVLIVGEVKQGNETWYKVQSDLNIDGNYNEITSGNYNWNGYAYVNAAYIKKINTGKNGYIAPTSVTEYQNSRYEYNLYIENTEFKPRVGISTKNTPYYFDSSLTSAKGQTLLKDRYVIVYSVATLNNQPVSYLVSSDYFYDQKHWVSADSIKLTNTPYGKVTVDTDDNQYTWVNYNTEDKAYSKISGLYTYAIVPILESVTVNGEVWYKVPVSLSTNDNVYGYTLAKYSNYISISVSSPPVESHPPVITAEDKELEEGDAFDPKEGVAAYDTEDGDLTSKIEVTKNDVNTNIPGVYEVTYKVSDSANQTVTKTIHITVLENESPVINATDKTILKGTVFNPLDNVIAYDKEDGDITNKINVVSNNVNTSILGIYEVTYEVEDSKNHKTTKTISVEVKDTEEVEGLFYFDYIKKVDNKLQIKGYETIQGIDNTLDIDINYYLIFHNIDKNENIKLEMTRITDKSEITRPIYSVDGKDYTYSWFKYNFDLTKIPQGNYSLKVIAESEVYYSENTVTNKLNKEQVTNFDGDKSLIIYNNYNDRTSPVELIVRSEKLATKTAGSYYNQFDTYRVFEFLDDNKLHLRGLSYSFGMDLGKDTNVERKIIFENKNDYTKYSYDLGSITTGNYKASLPENDNLDKTRAWYDNTIDISIIKKGDYVIYITTKSNVTDIAEFSEKLNREIDLTKTFNNKTYTFSINESRGNRIELSVE